MSQEIPNSRQAPAPQAAVWSPPAFPVFSTATKTNKPKELVSSLRVNSRRITLEHSSLDGLKKSYGATMGQSGDAGESLEWLCINGKNDEHHWVLWIESGEIDGGMVGGFQLRRIGSDITLDPRCLTVEAPGVVSTMPNSLTVGMTESEVIKVLGKPTARKPNHLYYEHRRKTVIRGETYDVVNSVTMLLHDGVVWAIQVRKTTSS